MSAVVQRLARFQSGEILEHLLALPADDLRLRFGAPLGTVAIEKYVNGIDFSNDRVFGIFDADLKLVSLAHLAVDREGRFAELGLSVAREVRRQGHGEALLQRGATHAASLGMRTIYMHCLSENHALMGLARKSGFKIVVDHGEADATKQIDETRSHGIAMEMVNDQMALVDSMLLRHSKMVRTMAGIGEAAPAA